MAVPARVGWTISAAIFLLVASSVLHADYTGLVPAVLLAGIVVVCAWRPQSGLEIVSAAMPLSWYLMQRRWNGGVSWAEVMACGALAGLSIDAAWRQGRGRVPASVAAPALLFGLIVFSAIVSSLAVKSLTLGPAFRSDLFGELTREYFVDLAGYPGLHAGMLLLEGLLFFTFAARMASEKSTATARIIGAAAVGATLAGSINVARLAQAALRSDKVFTALAHLSRTVRWNVEYGDYNAAGSYFVMALFLAAAAIVSSARHRRAWTVAAIVIATALWLTGSRAAYVAGVLAVATASALQWVRQGRRRFVVAGALAVAALAFVTVIALAAPKRGNQQSSKIAADIRLQMAMVGARMIEAHPVYGIGLGEFYQRSGDFTTFELLTAFPVSMHENAHNNFVQDAAELGLLGGVAFVWLVAAGLVRLAREVVRTRAPAALWTFSAVFAFVITWLAGHPLLIPEPGYVFWIVFGAAVASAAAADDMATPRQPFRPAIAILAAAIAIAMPFHARAVMEDAELEHVGFGWSTHWMLSPDGIRYRAAQGNGTVFVPAGSGLTFSVNPRTDRPVRLEVRLEGRIANVLVLAPGKWNDVAIPARSERPASRFIPLNLRVRDDDQVEIWLTKVRPLDMR